MVRYVVQMAVFVSCGRCNGAPQTGKLKTQKCIISRSGDQDPETKVLAGPVPRERSGGPFLTSSTPGGGRRSLVQPRPPSSRSLCRFSS